MLSVAMKIVIALAFMPFVWCSQKFVPGKNSQCLLYLYFTDLNKSSYKCAQKARTGKLTRLLLTPINRMQTLALTLTRALTLALGLFLALVIALTFRHPFTNIRTKHNSRHNVFYK